MRNRPKEDMGSALAGVLANKREQEGAAKNPAPPVTGDEWGNLTIRVRKRLRKRWVAAARMADTTLTDVIIEFLTNRFGGSESP